MLRAVHEPVAPVEDAQVVDVLDVALLEAQPERVLLREEVHRVERLRLRLGDGRDARRPRQREEAGEDAPRVLDDDPRVVPEEERARHVRRVRAEAGGMWYREMQTQD
jgi:hypothetical protein